jgi:transposase
MALPFSHIHDEFQWNPEMGIPPVHILAPTSRRRKNRTASRDQKHDVQMAAHCGLNTRQIMKMLDLTQRQVLYALETPATPKKSTGKPLILNTEQRAQLVEFICQSKKNRQISYKELAKEFSYWDAGHKAIKNALDREGFHLRWAMRKPLISEKNRKLLLAFAKAHKK